MPPSLPLAHLLASTGPADFSGRRHLSDVSTAIAKAKKVIVISGAGISCSSGIPDFRSEGGLYNLVKNKYPDAFFTGKDLFSAGTFANPLTTAIFYTFIAELSLSCNQAKPTRTHRFIETLHEKKKLMRSYTQNVDGLERRMGLESGGRGKGLKKLGTKNVELHGDLGRVRCVLCFSDYEATAEYVEMFREGEAPECPSCMERCESRINRSARATAVGTLRPSIVLYDEPHPLGDDIGSLAAYDAARSPDVLLIMGTSLKVHGLKRLVKEFAKAVHGGKKPGMVVFVNATAPSKEWEGIIDVHIEGETDMWVEKVEEDWRSVRPGDWMSQTLLDKEIFSAKKAQPKGKKLSDRDTNRLPTPPTSPTLSSLPASSQDSCGAVSDIFGSQSSAVLPSSQATQATDVEDTVETLSAPPTPLSPTKRPPKSQASPNKKSKGGMDDPLATPDRKKLFQDVKNASSPHRSADEDVFGTSPEKKPATASRPKERATRTRGKGESGKENVPVNAVKVRKTRAQVAASAALDRGVPSPRVTRRRAAVKA
ncbi:hypothetical protein IAR50_002025 [Cryptococcus sp. DSM 104548]